jgi:anti-anti-sigma factor
MADKPIEAQVRHHSNVAIIDLQGEVDGFAESALNAAYAQATRDKPASILLNFKNVDYINSTGIALIVGLMAQARKSGTKFLAAGLSDHYMEIFRLTRLSDFMSIYPDETAALADA